MQAPESNQSPPVEVLAVEDSATQRELLRFILERYHYRVRTAGDGEEALQQLSAGVPDLILSDIVMPGIDGYELCRRVKADVRLRTIPVVLLTSLANPEDVIRGLECGADNFIVKPFEEEVLLARLRDVVANRASAAAEAESDSMEVIFSGRRYAIRSPRRKILNLLLSTYEAAVRKNTELQEAQSKLQAANLDLEKKVQERTARLEEANRSLESFTYTIAHDLRAPLRAIHGFTSMLLDEHKHLYDESARDYSRRVINAAARMDQLIQDLLAFGRVAQAEFPLANVSLEQAVDSVLRQLAPEIARHEGHIEVIRPLPLLRANATVLEQVLGNLITNGLKFHRDGVAPHITIRAEPRTSVARCLVSDNGIGIEPRHCERIFHLFERLHDSKKYPGTGIGLVIVQKGVERMGGKVGVESKPGVGSTFWFELALAAE